MTVTQSKSSAKIRSIAQRLEAAKRISTIVPAEVAHFSPHRFGNSPKTIRTRTKIRKKYFFGHT